MYTYIMYSYYYAIYSFSRILGREYTDTIVRVRVRVRVRVGVR